MSDAEYPPGPHLQQRPPDRPQHPALRAAAATAGGAGLGAYAATMQRSHAMQDPFLPEISGQPNRHNATPALSHLSAPSPFLSFNHNLHRPSPPLPAAFPSSSPTDRDPLFLRPPLPAPLHLQPSAPSIAARSTLWWGELEPWMDEEYAKQVCSLMKWDPVSIKVPHPPPDPSNGQQPNNPGYCFITFPTPAYAASVLAQVAAPAPNGSSAITMPNSTKPFVMNWASSVTSTSSPMAASFPVPPGVQPQTAQQYPKEYSIFVGDLAPETSNSDLVAVFRNPVLGLRNDREPKFIRPFLSCKSAKIMLDPLTGVSRGYGFVRFTDEADQQRALIEMHGLYCLSRPMRISPATAKFKAPTTVPAFDLQQVSFTPPALGNGADVHNSALAAALPAPGPIQNKSVSAPIAAAGSNMSLSSNATSSAPSASSIGGSLSSNSLSSGTGSSASIATSAFANSPEDVTKDMLARLAQQYAELDVNGYKNLSSSAYFQDSQMDPARYMISEESWKHHAQARAILGNLIGPNGEQLTSTDPYNTTVFVGGLSPLISEETLRTFFAPFGDIHYVKVPVGKHCGFVQFVRKADAEKAIEKMQGFPIGGSRIRLSWGRSQYKAAQAAAQAAQTASILPQFTQSMSPPPPVITQERAMNIVQKFNAGYYNGGGSSGTPEAHEIENALLSMRNEYGPAMLSSAQLQQKLGQHIMQQRQQQQQEQHPQAFQQQHQQQQHQHDENSSLMNNYGSRVDAHRASLNFSPFSPEPNNLYMSSEPSRRDSYSRMESLPHPSKAYAPGFFPMHQGQDLKVGTGSGNPNASKISPTATRPSSSNLYGFSDNSDPPTPINRAPGRAEAPISRPGSGQMAVNCQSELHEIQDLNGTLASLDLDRPWKSPEAAGSR